MLSMVRNSKLSVYHLIACAVIFFVSGLLYLSQHHFRLRSIVPSHPPLAFVHPPAPPPLDLQAGHNAYNGDFRKPPGLKIVGLVFYGRREFVEILNCYLQRNLVDNGGFLDEVMFAVNTNNEGDLAYLEELLAANPQYKKHKAEKDYAMWMGNWEMVQRENLYIKIDDDVIFFEDATIPSIVRRMTEDTNYFAVSANVINNPALSWVHYSMGVYEPYFPELEAPNPPAPANAWRASELPQWTGPANFKFDGSSASPRPNHRWLPLPRTHDIVDTPAAALSYDAYGGGLHDWAAAAQTHYSFLSHLEKKDVWRYKFDLWDYHYARLSINFLGIWGKDIVDAFPFPIPDDEQFLTQTRPQELKRHVIVDGHGLAVHFAFGPQRRVHDGNSLSQTDLLSRYKAYAQEMVCRRPANGTKAR